jgi:hypothetical protein
MTESKENQLESLCADVPYMFVLNPNNEIVYVVNDTCITNSTTEEEYRQAMDSFIARHYQFKSLYEIVSERTIELHPKTNHKRVCMQCVGKTNVPIIHDMCIHEFIGFLERVFRERNIISL